MAWPLRDAPFTYFTRQGYAGFVILRTAE